MPLTRNDTVVQNKTCAHRQIQEGVAYLTKIHNCPQQIHHIEFKTCSYNWIFTLNINKQGVRVNNSAKFLIFFKQNLLKHQRRSQRILASINKKEPHNSITVCVALKCC